MKNSELYKDLPFAKPITEKKIVKKIPVISQKKKERIKNEWSEFDLFMKIAQERSINGLVLAKDIDWKTKWIRLEDLRVINFSHIKPKWMNKSLRLDPNNVEIVTFSLHFLEHTGLRYMGAELPN